MLSPRFLELLHCVGLIVGLSEQSIDRNDTGSRRCGVRRFRESLSAERWIPERMKLVEGDGIPKYDCNLESMDW